MSDKLSEYERKRTARRRPSRSVASAAESSRSSSCSATTRGGCTTTSASSGTACSPRGPCRKACRSSPGSSISPSTSRTIRSSYATFAGEIPKGNYGAGTVEIWDHGTYELVEEKPDGGLTVRLHGERLEGTWTLVPAHLSGDEKNWLLLRKRDETTAAAPGGASFTSRCSRRLWTSSRPATGWLFEPKWDGYRALALRPRRRGDAALAPRQRPDRAVRRRSRRRCRTRSARPTRSSTARCARSTRTAGRASRRCSRARDAARLRDLRRARDRRRAAHGAAATERRERLEELVDPERASSRSPASSTTARRSTRRRRSRGSRASWRRRPRRGTSEGKRARRLAEDQDARPPGVRDLRLDEGPGPARGDVRLARARRAQGQGVRLGRERRHRLQREDDRRAAREAPAARARDVAVRGRSRRCRRSARATSSGSSRSSSCEVEFLEWTHDGHLRAPSFQGLRDDKPARAVRREDPHGDRTTRGLKLSNLDKLFWPETKGRSRRATSSTTTAPSRPFSSRI